MYPYEVQSHIIRQTERGSINWWKREKVDGIEGVITEFEKGTFNGFQTDDFVKYGEKTIYWIGPRSANNLNNELGLWEKGKPSEEVSLSLFVGKCDGVAKRVSTYDLFESLKVPQKKVDKD